jgi:hypothetical protein
MPPKLEERAAEFAVKRHSARLTKLGAHSFFVGELTRGGKKRIGIIANFPQSVPRDLPEALEVSVGGKKMLVPLRGVPKVARFQPE